LRTQLTAHGKTSNLHGEIIQLMLITSAGAEGINLRNTRVVHLMEPYWHNMRLEQVIGRARRLHGHDDLPPEERSVTAYLYMATFTAEQRKVYEKEPAHTQDMVAGTADTSDGVVRAKANQKEHILTQLLDIMKASSLECKQNCTTAPEHEDMYDGYNFALEYTQDAEQLNVTEVPIDQLTEQQRAILHDKYPNESILRVTETNRERNVSLYYNRDSTRAITHIHTFELVRG
jgi:hypothetical protein